MASDIELISALRVFEGTEKVRKAVQTRLAHLQNNRRCLACGRDFMPKSFEPCPQCGSEDTKLLKLRRKCRDCGFVWLAPEIGVCTWCKQDNSEPNPLDDPFLRQQALPRLQQEETFYEAELRRLMRLHPVWLWASDVKGAGLTNVARVVGRIDIRRLGTPSAMWAHAGFGLDKQGRLQRKRKGETIDYDPQLQSACIMLGESLLKQADSYYQYYSRVKAGLTTLEPGHAHNRAYRHMIKLFLSHLWQIWREAAGLEAPAPYAFAILKHAEGHRISPGEMQKRRPV